MSGPDVRDDDSATPDLPAQQDKPVEAWEQIEAGRFMPRRVRGSCPGRELG